MDTNAFFMLFVDSGFNQSFWKKSLSGGNWYMEKKPITRKDVENHLNERYWVGVRRKNTPYFILDIDVHSEEAAATRNSRVEKVISCFDEKPLMIQSSSSGGVHMYYFLDKSYSVEKVQEVVKRVLGTNGVDLAYGKIELYPSYKTPVRLPLGKDSFLLNNNLETLGIEKKEATRRILEYRLETKNLFSLDKLDIDTRYIVPRKNSTVVLDNNLLYSNNVYTYLPDTQSLWENGLTESGTRNKAVMLLVDDCFKAGMSEDNAYTRIANWLAEKHNGESKEWLKNPEAVLLKLKNTIRLRYEFVKRRGICLAREDVNQLLLLVGDDYTQLQYCYSLLLHFKSFNAEVLNISRKVIQQMEGTSNRTYVRKMEFCIQQQLVEVEKEYSVEMKKARQYRCLYQFSESDNLVPSLNAAVWDILGTAGVRRKFGEYRLREIRRKNAAA